MLDPGMIRIQAAGAKAKAAGAKAKAGPRQGQGRRRGEKLYMHTHNSSGRTDLLFATARKARSAREMQRRSKGPDYSHRMTKKNTNFKLLTPRGRGLRRP